MSGLLQWLSHGGPAHWRAAVPAPLILVLAAMAVIGAVSVAVARARRGGEGGGGRGASGRGGGWRNGKGRGASGRDSPPARRTYRAKPLLSEWEREAFPRLLAALPPGLHLCPQVRLADMLNAGNGGGWTSALSQVASKSVDFAVIDGDGTVVLVIELNDKTHDQPERRRRDAFVGAALAQAGIPLAAFKPNQSMDLSRWLGR